LPDTLWLFELKCHKNLIEMMTLEVISEFQQQYLKVGLNHDQTSRNRREQNLIDMIERIQSEFQKLHRVCSTALITANCLEQYHEAGKRQMQQWTLRPLEWYVPSRT